MVPMNMEVKQEIVPSLFRESNLKPLSLYISAVKIVTGAEGGTRTPTSCLTRPSNVRVCQFRHFG